MTHKSLQNIAYYYYILTIMHSSRMRTIRCSSRLLEEGGVCPGGVYPGVCLHGGSAQGEGVSAQGRGSLPRGVGLPRGGGVCQGGVWQTPPGMTDRQV